MKKSILIVISIFLSNGVFAYEKEYWGEKSGNICYKGKWMGENLYNTLKSADETAHWSDMYESEAKKNRKCPNGKKYMIERGEEKKKLLRNQVIKNSGKEQTNRVIGDNHKGETLYGWGELPGIVWKVVGLKLDPVYKGDVKNGKPNGLGFIIYPGGSTYVGEFKDGRKSGQGTLTYPGGSKYVGEWKDGGLWNGIGYNNKNEITSRWVRNDTQ